MNKKIITAIIAVIVIVVVVWTYQAGGEEKTIKIGIVAPLTGGASIYGNALWKGAELALADLADTKNKYEIIIEDDGTNPGQSASGAQKLISIDGVSAIITITSGTGNAVAALAEEAQIPHICVCNDVKVGENKYSFNNLGRPEVEGKMWVDEAYRLGNKKVAILSQNHPGLNGLVDAVESEIGLNDMELVYSEKFDATTRDFKTMISKARQTSPDIYLLLAFPPSLDIAGQEFANLGIKNISSIAIFSGSAKPELYEGMWFIDPILADLEFKDRFESLYPDVKFNVRAAPFGYDSFAILVDAIESKDSLEYLNNLTKYDGKVGEITQKVGSHYLESTPTKWIMENNMPKQL